MKAAAAGTVRECDEEGPGKFVAYVDEGDDSFDVSLTLNADRQPERGSCDCDNRKPCRHIAALYLFVSSGSSVKAAAVAPSKTRKKKQTPAEVRLGEVDVTRLKAWLLEVFATHKELELAFLNRFRNAGVQYSADDVKRLSAEAVKTVLGRTQKPDPTQVKRVLQLWKDLHRPVIERYRTAPAERAAFEPLRAVIDTGLQFYRSHTGSGKMLSYVRDLLLELAPIVAALKQDEAFQQAAAFFSDLLASLSLEPEPIYLVFVDALAQALTGDRLSWLAARVGDQFCRVASGRTGYPVVAYWQGVLDLVVRAGMLRHYASCFDPIRDEDRYNLSLIENLSGIGDFERAAGIGWSMVRIAKRGDVVDALLQALRELYSQSGNEAGLLTVLRETVPRTFSYEDFTRVAESIADDRERKAYRDKMLKKAAARGGYQAGVFTARLFAAGLDWKRFLAEIQTGTVPYSMISRYFLALHNYNAAQLLQALFRRYDGWNYGLNASAEEQEGFMQLLEQTVTAYGRAKLLAELQVDAENAYHLRRNNLFTRALQSAMHDPQ